MVKVSSKCNDGTDVTMVNEQFKSSNCGVSSCQLNNINIRWNVLDKPTLHNCKKMHFGIKNKIGTNIRRTSIARLTGMTKQARGREHQTRGDISKTF